MKAIGLSLDTGVELNRPASIDIITRPYETPTHYTEQSTEFSAGMPVSSSSSCDDTPSPPFLLPAANVREGDSGKVAINELAKVKVRRPPPLTLDLSSEINTKNGGISGLNNKAIQIREMRLGLGENESDKDTADKPAKARIRRPPPLAVGSSSAISTQNGGIAGLNTETVSLQIQTREVAQGADFKRSSNEGSYPTNGRVRRLEFKGIKGGLRLDIEEPKQSSIGVEQASAGWDIGLSKVIGTPSSEIIFSTPKNLQVSNLSSPHQELNQVTPAHLRGGVAQSDKYNLANYVRRKSVVSPDLTPGTARSFASDNSQIAWSPAQSADVSSSSVSAESSAISRMSRSDFVSVGFLGRGQNGAVTLAVHLPLFRLMALKVMNIYVKDARKQLIEELKTFKENKHQNLIQLFGCFFDEGKIVLALEYMNAGSLGQWVEKNGVMSERVAASVMRQAVEGLKHLHERCYVHGDIKPENILVSLNGEAKITDFGLAREVRTQRGVSEKGGTRLYLSPERYSGKPFSFPADVWALGLSLIMICSSKEPYESKEYWGLAYEVMQGPSPKMDRAEFSSDICDFVDGCLRKDPNSRLTCDALSKLPFCRAGSRVTPVSEWKDAAEERVKNGTRIPEQGDQEMTEGGRLDRESSSLSVDKSVDRAKGIIQTTFRKLRELDIAQIARAKQQGKQISSFGIVSNMVSFKDLESVAMQAGAPLRRISDFINKAFVEQHAFAATLQGPDHTPKHDASPLHELLLSPECNGNGASRAPATSPQHSPSMNPRLSNLPTQKQLGLSPVRINGALGTRLRPQHQMTRREGSALTFDLVNKGTLDNTGTTRGVRGGARVGVDDKPAPIARSRLTMQRNALAASSPSELSRRGSFLGGKGSRGRRKQAMWRSTSIDMTTRPGRFPLSQEPGQDHLDLPGLQHRLVFSPKKRLPRTASVLNSGQFASAQARKGQMQSLKVTTAAALAAAAKGWPQQARYRTHMRSHSDQVPRRRTVERHLKEREEETSRHYDWKDEAARKLAHDQDRLTREIGGSPVSRSLRGENTGPHADQPLGKAKVSQARNRMYTSACGETSPTTHSYPSLNPSIHRTPIPRSKTVSQYPHEQAANHANLNLHDITTDSGSHLRGTLRRSEESTTILPRSDSLGIPSSHSILKIHIDIPRAKTFSRLPHAQPAQPLSPDLQDDVNDGSTGLRGNLRRASTQECVPNLRRSQTTENFVSLKQKPRNLINQRVTWHAKRGNKSLEQKGRILLPKLPGKPGCERLNSSKSSDHLPTWTLRRSEVDRAKGAREIQPARSAEAISGTSPLSTFVARLLTEEGSGEDLYWPSKPHKMTQNC